MDDTNTFQTAGCDRDHQALLADAWRELARARKKQVEAYRKVTESFVGNPRLIPALEQAAAEVALAENRLRRLGVSP